MNKKLQDTLEKSKDKDALDYIKTMVKTPLEEWSTEELTMLIKVIDVELREWERVKAEALWHLGSKKNRNR